MSRARDVEKIVANKGIIDPYYDITLAELHQLKSKAEGDNTCEAIISAFYFGYVMGQRATKKKLAKK